MKPQEILKQAREKSGYTQEVMADKIGVSGRMYQRYESGKFPKFKGEAVEKLDKLLGTNLGYLLYDKNGRAAKPEDEIKQTALPTGSIKRTLADYISMIELYNETLSNAINNGLIQIKVSLKDVSGKIESMDQSIRVNQNVIIGSLEEIAGKQPGTLLKEADTLEHDLNTLREDKSKKAPAGKPRK